MKGETMKVTNGEVPNIHPDSVLLTPFFSAWKNTYNKINQLPFKTKPVFANIKMLMVELFCTCFVILHLFYIVFLLFYTKILIILVE